MGHLIEICEGSDVSAIINYNKVPVFDEIHGYIDKKCVPGGTLRNWDSYGHKLTIENEKQRYILCDPQTSGGLLIAVKKESAQKVASLLRSKGLFAEPIGEIIEKAEMLITVNDGL
jgi:selenide,water dikinase